MRVAPILLAFMVAGCRQAPAPDVPLDTAPAAVASPSLAPVTTLEGEWRVAGIDGAPFDKAYGLALSGDADEIWWEPRCDNAAFGYRIEGTRIVTGEARPPAPVEPGQPSRPVCTVKPPAALREVVRALESADTVGRTPENGVLISGGGHSLLLFSQ